MPQGMYLIIGIHIQCFKPNLSAILEFNYGIINFKRTFVCGSKKGPCKFCKIFGT